MKVRKYRLKYLCNQNPAIYKVIFLAGKEIYL
nr:MAG TPA: hypothetical protein [Caudoviricetes sp.]DAY86373.1 MAG TPA: hypothetical protein [Caudoviricetes sp.]